VLVGKYRKYSGFAEEIAVLTMIISARNIVRLRKIHKTEITGNHAAVGLHSSLLD
jgi:hypothetical protein